MKEIASDARPVTVRCVSFDFLDNFSLALSRDCRNCSVVILPARMNLRVLLRNGSLILNCRIGELNPENEMGRREELFERERDSDPDYGTIARGLVRG
jgi:hypothetical protein